MASGKMTKAGTITLVLFVLAVLATAGAPRAEGEDPGRGGGSKPPVGPERLQRVAYDDGRIDVAVIGSELEGLYLAARAREAGLHPLVIEPNKRIGGQLLRAQMLYLDGVYDANGKELMQGGFADLFAQYKNGDIRRLGDFRRYVHGLLEGVPVETEAKLGDVRTENGRVTEIDFADAAGNRHTIRPAYAVDNSDAALLVDKLGVRRLPGLEALYGAPGKEYMSATFMIHLDGVDWERFNSHFWQMDKLERTSRYGPETYVDPSLAYGFPAIAAAYALQSPESTNLRGLNLIYQGRGEVLINALQVYDVDPSDPASVKRGMETAKKELPYIRDHLRRHLVGFERARLAQEPEYLYIREYNHYPTDYVMQASDLLSGRMFWDNVSIGGYFLDIQGSRSNREGLAVGRPDKYGLPLRSYLLKDYDNVVLTGKLVGSTAVAYGSTRIQANGSLAAETIGWLMGDMQGESLKRVTSERITRLQERLARDKGIRLHMPQGANRIAGLHERDVADLNHGHVTLLPGGVVARHLPFIKVQIGTEDIAYKGVRPLIIDGATWVPLEETFRKLGAADVKADLERGIVRYSREGGTALSVEAPLYVWNNHVLVALSTVAKALPYRAEWNEAHRVVRLERADAYNQRY